MLGGCWARRRFYNGRLRAAVLTLLLGAAAALARRGVLEGAGPGGGHERDGARGGGELDWEGSMAERLLVLLGAVQKGEGASPHDEVGVDVILADAGVGGQVGVGVREGRVAP